MHFNKKCVQNIETTFTTKKNKIVSNIQEIMIMINNLDTHPKSNEKKPNLLNLTPVPKGNEAFTLGRKRKRNSSNTTSGQHWLLSQMMRRITTMNKSPAMTVTTPSSRQ